MSVLFKKVKRALNNYNPDIFKILANLGKDKIIIAGGAVRAAISNEKIQDIDFYLSTTANLDEVVEMFKEYCLESVFTSENAITFKDEKGKTYQLITCLQYEPGNILEMLSDFDFTVTMGAFCNESLIISEEALMDIAGRQLKLSDKKPLLKYPISTLVRVLKYQKYGYTISPLTLVRISLAIHSLQIETYSDMKEQLMGIDTTIFDAVFENKGNLTLIKFELNRFTEHLEEYFNTLF